MIKITNITNSLLKYLVGACMLAIPLYSKFPFINVPGTFVAIRIEDFLIALTAFVWAVAARADVKRIFRDNLSRSIVLYIFIGFVSLASAILVTDSVEPAIGFLHALRRIEYFIPFFAARHVIRNQKDALSFYVTLIFIVVGVSFFYGLGQRYLSWPIIITQNQEYSKGVALRFVEGSHINATFAGHYDLAAFMVMVLPIAITTYFVVKGKLGKIAIFSILVAGLWLLANAVSRISIASYLISAVIALLLIKKFRYILPIVILSVFVFATSSTVITRYMRIYEVVISEVSKQTQIVHTVIASEITPPPDLRIEGQQPSALPEDRSTSIRFNVEWPRAIRAFTKNPLVGTGFSSITLATDNDYLRALGETGILGFISFSLVFICLITFYIRALPNYKKLEKLERAFIAGSFAALPGIFIIAIFIDIFVASKFVTMFWFIQGISMSLIELRTEKYDTAI